MSRWHSERAELRPVVCQSSLAARLLTFPTFSFKILSGKMPPLFKHHNLRSFIATSTKLGLPLIFLFFLATTVV